MSVKNYRAQRLQTLRGVQRGTAAIRRGGRECLFFVPSKRQWPETINSIHNPLTTALFWVTSQKTEKTTKSQMAPQLLSTGQAAERCAVTPDAVLKWIRSGRLRARRTAGGHHRIDPRDLDEMMGEVPRPVEEAPDVEGLRIDASTDRHFRYCWEYDWDEPREPECSDCVVYRLRAQRCYEMAKQDPESRASLSFCDGACETCDYYSRVQAQTTNVLVVTDDKVMAATLGLARPPEDFDVRVADCEYTCSLMVDTFRPDFVVVDCTLGPDLASQIRYHLSQDPRIPFVRIILATGPEESVEACKGEVFAILQRPFELKDVAACVRGVQQAVVE